MFGEIGGVGDVNGQISSFAQQMGESGRIVRQMYQDLDDFKAAVDKNIKQETLTRIRDRLEQLENQLGNLSPAALEQLSSQLANFQSAIDSLRIDGTVTPLDAQQVSDIQQQIESLREQLGSL